MHNKQTIEQSIEQSITQNQPSILATMMKEEEEEEIKVKMEQPVSIATALLSRGSESC